MPSDDRISGGQYDSLLTRQIVLMIDLNGFERMLYLYLKLTRRGAAAHDRDHLCRSSPTEGDVTVLGMHMADL